MLAVRNLKFSHGSKAILDDATIVFDDVDRTALVGDNGAGKSTLMNLLAGTLKADGGTIERGRGQTLSFLSQEPQLDLGLSARDAVALSGREPWEVDEALSRLNVSDPDKKVGDMSGGQRRRVDLARVLLEESDILMLDEPTNHLDRTAIAYVVERVRRWRGPVIVISHDRAFLDDMCTRVVELSRGKLHSYAPPADSATSLTTSFIEQKLVRDDVMVQTQHKKERLWVRELAWLRAGTPARTTKQTARIDRAGELQEFVETEAAAIRHKQKTATLENQSLKRLGKTIIECQKLAIDRGGKRLFNNLDLVVTKGQRWGVVGENGAGKTSFVLAIQTACKRDLPENEIVKPASGKLIIGENTKIAVFDQHRQVLNGEATLDETLAADNDHVFFGEQRIHVSSWLERFLFDGSDRKRRVKTLSGGEQNRLVLSKLFLGDANVLLLDEPTNDLDVTTLGVLEEALLEFSGCAFIISHDRRFLDRTATGILAFEKIAEDVPAVVTPVIGDWTHYERTQAARLKALKGGGITGAVTMSTSSSSAKEKDAAAQAAQLALAAQQAAIDRAKRKRTNKEEREFVNMEATIQTKEARRDELTARVQSPEVSRDSFKLTEVSQDLARIESDIEVLYARWEALSNLLAP